MANIAQTINVLQAMILTHGDLMVVTPTGYVYEMYAPHQGGTSVPVAVESESLGVTDPDGEASMDVVAGSASLKEDALFVTLTNAHASDPQRVTISVRGATASGGSARVLTGEIHAHNTFAAPDAIGPMPMAVEAVGSEFVVALPPASVTALRVDLG